MSRLPWILYLSRRWFSSRRAQGGTAGSLLAAAGIGIGVAALIVVLGVMNGFQLGYIDSILEAGSFHVRIEASPGSSLDEGLARAIASLPETRSVLPFAESHVLLLSSQGSALPLKLRLLPRDAASRDPGMAKALGLPETGEGGLFSSGPGLVLGSELARYLGIRAEDNVELVLVSADVEEGMETRRLQLPVTALFRSGYYDFDFGLGLLPFDEAPELLAKGSFPLVYGVKLKDRYRDAEFAAPVKSLLVGRGLGAYRIEGWREYNRAFFGALRTEKSVMMMLVGLIFVVVGVNIYHAMRRTVAERTEDIAVLRALGAGSGALKTVFVLDGLAVGLSGALAGLILGLLIAINVNEVFGIVEALVNAVLGVLGRVLGGGAGGFRIFSPQYFYLMEVPVRVLFPETLFIVTAAIASAAGAAGIAAGRLAALEPAEILHYE